MFVLHSTLTIFRTEVDPPPDTGRRKRRVAVTNENGTIVTTHPTTREAKINAKPEILKTSINNKFEHLSNIDEIENVSTENIELNKLKRPSPIILHGVLQEHKKLVDLILKITITSKFKIRYGRLNTFIYFQDMSHYTKMRQHFRTSGQEFFTYTPKTEKKLMPLYLKGWVKIQIYLS